MRRGLFILAALAGYAATAQGQTINYSIDGGTAGGTDNRGGWH